MYNVLTTIIIVWPWYLQLNYNTNGNQSCKKRLLTTLTTIKPYIYFPFIVWLKLIPTSTLMCQQFWYDMRVNKRWWKLCEVTLQWFCQWEMIHHMTGFESLPHEPSFASVFLYGSALVDWIKKTFLSALIYCMYVSCVYHSGNVSRTLEAHTDQSEL